jgi:hypothetical protein
VHVRVCVRVRENEQHLHRVHGFYLARIMTPLEVASTHMKVVPCRLQLDNSVPLLGQFIRQTMHRVVQLVHFTLHRSCARMRNTSKLHNTLHFTHAHRCVHKQPYTWQELARENNNVAQLPNGHTMLTCEASSCFAASVNSFET